MAGTYNKPSAPPEAEAFQNFDVEGQEQIMDFSNLSCRRGFIKKVYSILMVQLLITGGFIALFLFNPELRKLVQESTAIVIGACILSIIIVIVLACSQRARRTFPLNFIILILFTVVEGFLVGTIASFYETESVLLAAGITAILCLSLTIFAFQTKIDFTGMGPYLFVALIGLMIFGLAAGFLSRMFPLVDMVYGCVGAVLFSMYLIYDTQLIIGGNHKQSISPEEYIMAAITLYLDILNIFIKILAVIGNKRQN